MTVAVKGVLAYDRGIWYNESSIKIRQERMVYDMQLRENAKLDLVMPTSMGVRIMPADHQPAAVSNHYLMTATSAESNAGSISAALGMNVSVLTKFVKDSVIAEFIRRDLRARNMKYEGPEVVQDGPWGFRHQFNIADTGYGARGAKVQNDRAGEVGVTIKAEDFDLDRIFAEDGVKIVHTSGLFTAMSADTADCALKIARKAKETGAKVSFDMNYRASFWKGREKELRATFSEIAANADILMGNEEDFQLALGIEGPEAGGKDLSGKIDRFKELISRVKERYPNVSVFGTTLREVVSASENLWGAILSVGDEWYVEEPRPIQVLDRIGGGDGFAGGLLYAILKGLPQEDWIKMGWAGGALTVTLLTDYALPASEAELWNIWKGNARVVR